MSDFNQILTSLREQMAATLSRSDVLRPLAWLIALLLPALIGSAWLSAPSTMQILLGVAFGLSCLLYLGAYVFCLIKNPDHLRSERYSLHKLAIENKLLGDSDSELFEERDIEQKSIEVLAPEKQVERKK